MSQLPLWDQEIALGEIHRQSETVQDVLESRDREERRRGGRWQECARLGPGEDVVVSAALNDVIAGRRVRT